MLQKGRSLVVERGESEVHKDMYKENTSLKPLAGKMRGAEFCVFATNGLKD